MAFKDFFRSQAVPVLDERSRMNVFWWEMRFAARALLKRPGFSAAAILTLALALGSTTVIFGFVDGVLLRPLPYADPDRLASV